MRHVPVNIVTGFLGSGKTTLINRILKENHGVRFAVIVNELGEIGLDAGLIEGPQDFVKMDNGCLCCVLSDELLKTIEALKQRDDFDAVILETTGIADPLPIAWPFLREEFKDKFRFGGILTVVDSLHFKQMLVASFEAKTQIERADYLYLSKTDLCNATQKETVVQELKNLNANARFIFSDEKDWIWLLLGELEVSRLPRYALVKTSKDHSAAFETVSIRLDDQSFKIEDIEDVFENLPQEVFRAKAIFKEKASARTIVIHSVCGRVDFYDIKNYTGDLAVVFIGKNLPQKNLKQLFATPKL